MISVMSTHIRVKKERKQLRKEIVISRKTGNSVIAKYVVRKNIKI